MSENFYSISLKGIELFNVKTKELKHIYLLSTLFYNFLFLSALIIFCGEKRRNVAGSETDLTLE